MSEATPPAEPVHEMTTRSPCDLPARHFAPSVPWVWNVPSQVPTSPVRSRSRAASSTPASETSH